MRLHRIPNLRWVGGLVLGAWSVFFLSGCAAGVIGAIVGAASGGGGGGGGQKPQPALTTIAPSFSASSGLTERQDERCTVAVVNLPENYTLQVDDVAIDSSLIVESANRRTITFPIPDHRFTYNARGAAATSRPLSLRPKKVDIVVTDTDTGQQTKLPYFYLPPTLNEVSPLQVDPRGLTLSEAVAALQKAEQVDALAADPEAYVAENAEDLGGAKGTLVTLRGEFYDFDDIVSQEGSAAVFPNLPLAVEKTKVFLLANGERVVDPDTLRPVELRILSPVDSDNEITVFVPAQLLKDLVDPSVQVELEVVSPNGPEVEKRLVSIAPPFPVERGEACVSVEAGEVTISWENNCDGPPLIDTQSGASVSNPAAKEFDNRFVPDGNGDAGEEYPGGFLIFRRQLGAASQPVIINEDTVAARLGEICNDGLDNDGDGLTDRQDPDCNGVVGGQDRERDCKNGEDDDDDGLTDRDDADCEAQFDTEVVDDEAGTLDPGFYCYEIIGRLFKKNSAEQEVLTETGKREVVVPILRAGETYDIIWNLSGEKSVEVEAKTALQNLGRNAIVFTGRRGIADAFCGPNLSLLSQIETILLLYGEVTADVEDDVESPATPLLFPEDIQFIRNEFLSGASGNRGRLWVSSGDYVSTVYRALSGRKIPFAAPPNRDFIDVLLGRSENPVGASANASIAKELTQTSSGPGDDTESMDDDFVLLPSVAADVLDCQGADLGNLHYEFTGRRDDLSVLVEDGGTSIVLFRSKAGANFGARPPEFVSGVLNENATASTLVTTFTPDSFGTSNRELIFREALAALGVLFPEVCGNGIDDDCDGDIDEPAACASDLVSDVIRSVTSRDGLSQAALSTGEAPLPNDGPEIQVSGSSSAINGGTIQLSVDAIEGSFVAILVFLETASGFWDLPIIVDGAPGPQQSADILLSLAENLRAGTTFNVLLRGIGSDGRVGPEVAFFVEILEEVRTEGLQISVNWTEPSDVDLIVREPSGEVISFLNTESASGGTLDLDANFPCGTNVVNNENISWPAGQAPQGVYNIFLNLPDPCGAASLDYVVTLRVPGRAVQTFPGSFDAEDAFEDPRLITTFAIGEVP